MHRANHRTMQRTMQRTVKTVAAAALLLAPIVAMAAEGTFDKTLNVDGHATLIVTTGAGNITVKPGENSQVRVIGHVKTGWGFSSGDARVKEIVANPPIEQTGNILRIGKLKGYWDNVSIDYEITAPRDVELTATTGSGNIDAGGIGGALRAQTGSGNITASQVTGGEIKVQTGSGNIRLSNANGSLRAQTGSGSIDIGGKPAGEWRLRTGSGNVTLSLGNNPFTLEASTGSGSIRTAQTLAMEGSFDRHHVSGRANGGGPLVSVATGSGDIQIR